MSLVGSLEDLGLGEILQIISLSRKSGTLCVSSEQERGWIFFGNGEIRGASLAGESTCLAELLMKSGALPQPEVERLQDEVRSQGGTLEDRLIQGGLLDVERLDALRVRHVEGAVMRMFTWEHGDFSFDLHAREAPEPLPGGLLLARGINPQFLALEGTRLKDEETSEEPGVCSDDSIDEFEENWDRAMGLLEPEGGAPEGATAAAENPPRPSAVIVIDPDLGWLEAIKQALSVLSPRVHIFQRFGLALERVRQYLARAEIPLVLLSDRSPEEGLSGVRSCTEMISRLQSQSPRMRLFLVHDAEAGVAGTHGVEAVLARPTSADAGQLAEALRAQLGDLAFDEGVGNPDPASPTRLPEEEEKRLREATAELRGSNHGGDVVSVVVRFAARQFARVAVFSLGDGAAKGLTQVGLAAAGGPDDAGLRQIKLPARKPEWFRRVLESGVGGSAPPVDPGDRELLSCLGVGSPREAYVGPILCGGRVVALLYADDVPQIRPVGDTRALARVLAEAGLALDRALRSNAAD